MQIWPQNFSRELAKKPQWSALLVASDEPYLALEIVDEARHALRSRGIEERLVFEVDKGFSWQNFTEATLTQSLFSSEKIIELRFKERPSREAKNALIEYFQAPEEGVYLIITTPRLTKANLKEKWVTMLDRTGAYLVLYPPAPDEYPAWILARAEQRGLRLSRDAAVLLAHHNEGNLFSLMQELNYLALFFQDQEVSVESLEQLLVQSSKFVTFDLGDALLAGDLPRIYNIIMTLREEGDSVIGVNWVIYQEIVKLQEIHHRLAKGEPLERIYSGLWPKKRRLYEQAVRRIPLTMLDRLLKVILQSDLAAKGLLREEPWNTVLRIGFAFAGKRVLSLSAKVA